MNSKSKPDFTPAEKAPSSVEVCVLRGYQPAWDETKEPKPDQWVKNTVVDCPAGLVSKLVRHGTVKRVADMSNEELRKAGLPEHQYEDDIDADEASE